LLLLNYKTSDLSDKASPGVRKTAESCDTSFGGIDSMVPLAERDEHDKFEDFGTVVATSKVH
jgi:hypothetical protein